MGDWIEFGSWTMPASFTEQNLAVPGVQFELTDGRRYLVGDVNPVGGVCEDCMDFDPNDVVARYRVLFTPAEMEG